MRGPTQDLKIKFSKEIIVDLPREGTMLQQSSTALGSGLYITYVIRSADLSPACPKKLRGLRIIPERVDPD